MRITTARRTGPVSSACDRGQHARCSGIVAASTHGPDLSLAFCGCEDRGCDCTSRADMHEVAATLLERAGA